MQSGHQEDAKNSSVNFVGEVGIKNDGRKGVMRAAIDMSGTGWNGVLGLCESICYRVL